jgi:hypothetical protein
MQEKNAETIVTGELRIDTPFDNLNNQTFVFVEASNLVHAHLSLAAVVLLFTAISVPEHHAADLDHSTTNEFHDTYETFLVDIKCFNFMSFPPLAITASNQISCSPI